MKTPLKEEKVHPTRADARSGAVCFGIIVIALLAACLLHAANGETGEAVTMAFATMVPVTLMVACIRYERSVPADVRIHGDLRGCLSPVHTDPIRRRMEDPENSFPIG